MSDLQDDLNRLDDWLPDMLDQREPARYKQWFIEAYANVADAARKYQDILDTDIDEWIEAEAIIARSNGELSWSRLGKIQAVNLLAALGITEPVE